MHKSPLFISTGGLKNGLLSNKGCKTKSKVNSNFGKLKLKIAIIGGLCFLRSVGRVVIGEFQHPV